MGFDEHPGHHHEQRGRHTFAGNIRHNQTDVIVIDQEEIVEITANLFCGRHAGKDVKLRAIGKCGEEPGQLTGLYVRGHAQFSTHPGRGFMLLFVFLPLILHDHHGHINRRGDRSQDNQLDILKERLNRNRRYRRDNIRPERVPDPRAEIVPPADQKENVDAQHEEMRQIGEHIGRRSVINIPAVKIVAEIGKLRNDHQQYVHDKDSQEQPQKSFPLPLRVCNMQRKQ